MSRKPLQGRKLPCGVALLALCVTAECRAVSFNTQFLAGNSSQGDISTFYNDAALPDGKYDVDVYVNEEWKGKLPLILKKKRWLIQTADVSLLGLRDDTLADNATLTDIHTLIKQGTAQLSATDFSLRLQIPQAMIASSQRGYVAPVYWEQGIDGAVLSYTANYYHTFDKRTNSDDSNVYSALSSGLNLAGWQLRDNSTLLQQTGSGMHFQNSTRYVKRGISALQSELLLGDSYTGSDLFDSFKFRGLQLSTDTRMLPDSQQGFAPVIRGIAQTNALIKVIQNGATIAQLNVPPGPFTIDDILPTGSGGDLTVQVTEADGSSNQFIVPFSSVPNMLKTGVHKYSINAGQAIVNDAAWRPEFVQGTWQYGFNNTFTGYSGVIASRDYQSFLAGTGVNLAIGAVSFDVTQSRYRDSEANTRQGQSYKLAYSRFFPTSRTNFSLAAFRYSTRDYLSLTDAVQLRDYERDGLPSDHYRRQKNTFNLNLNQTLDNGWGSVFISGTFRRYWGREGSTKEYQAGYANSWGRMNYNLSASRTQSSHQQEENRFYLTLSLPISLFDNPAYITSSAALRNSRYANSNIGLGGSAGPSGRLNYNLNLADSRGGSRSGSVNASYKAQAATLNGAWSESADYRQLGLGASGSLSLTREGLLSANQSGDTFAIINAPGVAEAAVNGDRSVMTNGQGKALIATLSPYRTNRIMLDSPEDEGAELLGNMREVVPYAGAIAYLEYKTDRRQTYLIPARQSSGAPLPFGTLVTDGNGVNVGYVGQGSEIYVKADRPPTQLRVVLNREGTLSCQIIRPQVGREAHINLCRTP